MNSTHSLAPGLTEEVHDSQKAFRAVLDALARPGQMRRVGEALPNVPLGGAMARLLLSLTDDETQVWWQGIDASIPRWLRFHTGATEASSPKCASFAVLTDLAQIPTLADFRSGSAASPELSCTVFIELPAFEEGPTLEWRGPGIETVHHVSLQGLSNDFWEQWHANHASFPQGVDIVFACGESALGLPRTTRVSRLEGV